MDIITNDLPEPVVARMLWALVEGSEQVAIRTNHDERIVVKANEVRIAVNPVDGRHFVAALGTVIVYFDDLLTVESYR